MPASYKPFKISSRQYLLLAALIMTEVAVTAWLYTTIKTKEHQVHVQIFESQAKEITASIQKEITVNLEKILSLNALYDVTYPITREEFRDFAKHLINENSSIQALEWVPKVNEDQKTLMEQASGASGFSQLLITEHYEDQLLPAKQRSAYFPVYYVEPVDGNEKALGFDLSSNPTRMNAMEEADRNESMIVTEPLNLVQEDFSKKGVIAFYPFKRKGELLGYFTGVFNIDELIKRSVGDYLKDGFNLTIYDSTANDKLQLLYRLSEKSARYPEDNGNRLNTKNRHYRQRINVANRSWLVEITPDEKQLSLKSNAHFLVLILCIAISLGLCNQLHQHFKSENLLLNILPAEVAKELITTGKSEARDFTDVSILFTDFTGFTESAAKMSAHELVSEINNCFGAFDNIVTKYGLEKIKTIGDAYMAAGGLPVPDSGSAKKTVLAALEMQEFISHRKQENSKLGKIAFEMRVGIDTGPVVAGIVGMRKFQYDLWGDTVNTASRLEMTGAICKVNISQRTYLRIRDDPDFVLEQRGKMSVKGKGEMDMWFVMRNVQHS